MSKRFSFFAIALSVQVAAAQVDVSRQPFAQEERTSYTTEDGLPDNHIQAVGLLTGPRLRVLASTEQGVVQLTGKSWAAISKRHVPKWIEMGREFLWIADEGHVGSIGIRYFNNLPIAGIRDDLTIRALAASENGRVILGADDGIWELTRSGKQRATGEIQGRMNKNDLRHIAVFSEPVISLAISKNEDIAAGTARGLYVQSIGRQPELVFPEDERYRWAPRDVKAVAYDSLGRLWFGCPLGVGVRDAGGGWRLFTGREGLPSNEFTCAAAGADGAIWFGTTRGALRFDGKRWAYRAGLRWLPDDHVNDIAVDEKGAAWVATNGGISHIKPVEMTLADKANFFEEQVETRHNRMGFQAQCRLERRGDVTSWKPAVSDNDGQYTALYGAAEAFRWAATKDPEARRRARRSFEACKLLVDITPMPGFPARVVVPIEWLADENLIEIYGREYNKRKKKDDPQWKMIYPRWVKSKDGKYLWKCDTSTDEVAGHLFFYSVYYDLVADNERERAEVRQVMTAMVDHIIDNGFVLRDWDGKPTRWANWSPEHLNSKDGHYERGLNSLMMLALLATAEHMTKDARYADVAKTLRDEHAYHINTLYAKVVFPPTNDVPWDYMLAYLSYYPLLRYEKDPELRAIYLESLDRTWLASSRHKHPFYNFLYLALAKTDDPQKQTIRAFVEPKVGQLVAESIDTLRGIPLELLGWQMNNSHRLDVVRDPTPGRQRPYGWSVVDGGALPIEERYQVRLDRSSLLLDGVEGDGWNEHEGTIFLLPYYMGLYHGFIK